MFSEFKIITNLKLCLQTWEFHIFILFAADVILQMFKINPFYVVNRLIPSTQIKQ